ncbi:MAG TPA: hypothetical protein DDZ66_01835, partial [Firmicutes bacterium]|nr:hypothetical protein [Bacillota bacterium]
MIRHFRIRKAYATIKSSGLFDESYYLWKNPDVGRADLDAITHYLVYGATEGRDPSENFDTSYYLEMYEDVAKSGMNPLIHFIEFGANEGRNPSSKFDTLWYINHYPEVKIAKINPLLHYLSIGKDKDYSPRNPSSLKETQRLKTGRTLVQLSVIIPVFNALAYTKECIGALAHAIVNISTEIIVVNNASNDGTMEWLEEQLATLPNLKVIHNKENKGFAPAINQGIHASQGEYILILNNDTVPAINAIDLLLKAMTENEKLGIVSPVTNFVGEGPQLDPLAEDVTPGTVNHYAEMIANRDGVEFVPSRLVFFCVMIRRQLVDLIGVLDESYIRGNFEDDDYSLRTTIAGWKLGIVRNAFIFHHGSATFKSNKMEYAKHFEENRIKFFSKVDRLSVTPLRLSTFKKKEQTPVASVILRTVDRPRTLMLALNSLANQTRKDFEVVLVNDGGPDIQSMVDSYSDKLTIQYILNNPSKGRTGALNAGARKSRGEWICYLDDDDIYYPWFMETMLNAVAAHPNSKFLYGMAMRALFDHDLSYIDPVEIKAFAGFEYSRERLLVGNAIPINTWFHQRTLYEAVGGFDESFDTLEDYEFLLRATANITPILIPVNISEYRFYISFSNSIIRMREDALVALSRIYDANPVTESELFIQRSETLTQH